MCTGNALRIGAGIMVQLIATYIIPGVFGVVPLAFEHWGFVIALSLTEFFVVKAIKWRDYRPSRSYSRYNAVT